MPMVFIKLRCILDLLPTVGHQEMVPDCKYPIFILEVLSFSFVNYYYAKRNFII